jgi:hypothetical protein
MLTMNWTEVDAVDELEHKVYELTMAFNKSQPDLKKLEFEIEQARKEIIKLKSELSKSHDKNIILRNKTIEAHIDTDILKQNYDLDFTLKYSMPAAKRRRTY